MTPPRIRRRTGDPLVDGMTEAAWQAVVEAIARAHGWRIYHAPDNSPRTSSRGTRYVQNVRAGWPDLVLCKPPRLLVVELKRQTGRPTPEQLGWLDDLAACGVEAALWRPADRRVVEDVLAGRTLLNWPAA